MTAIIISLILLVIISLIISGYLFTHQQAILRRQQQTKHLQQKFQEINHWFESVFTVDDKPDIAMVIHDQRLDLAQQLAKLNKNSPQFGGLFTQPKQ